MCYKTCRRPVDELAVVLNHNEAAIINNALSGAFQSLHSLVGDQVSRHFRHYHISVIPTLILKTHMCVLVCVQASPTVAAHIGYRNALFIKECFDAPRAASDTKATYEVLNNAGH